MHRKIINKNPDDIIQTMEEITTTFPIINDRYKILNTISSGGMAVIYRAQDLVLDRIIALKILKKELSQDENFRNQFSIEAKATARLSHTNIVTTYDFGMHGDRLYIAMEYIEGTILKELIANSQLNFEQRMDYVKQACQGLAFAHQNKIVHCDIKPQNMLVSSEGLLKLTDFGISFILDSISQDYDKDEVWGSPYYIAPEIVRGESPSPKSDVYSMGVVMYELLTGQLPFTGEEVLEIIEKHQEEIPIPPNSVNKQIPSEINRIILTALEKDPEKRFTDGLELFSAIQNARIENNINRSESNGNIDDLSIENGELNIVPDEFSDNKLDWKTILLGFIAIIMVGGLIPFWLFVYYSINR